jgi:hypothetical protein
MFKSIARSSGALLTLGSLATTEAPGGDGDGVIEPGESGRIVLTANNDGAAGFAGSVTATLTAITPGIMIVNGSAGFGALGAFSSATNAGNPLVFAVPGAFAEPIAQLRVTLSGDGQSIERTISVVLGAFRLAVDDDMEQDRGFARGAGTATSGLFERAAPQATSSGGQTIQPGNDHTPSGTLCWITDGLAGTSAGNRDVDGGYTEVVSPVMDLSHLGVARLSFWRWYVDSVQDDPFEVHVSNDAGLTWQAVFSSSASTNAWVLFSSELNVALTDRMRFKVRVQDVNASLVEGGVDDLELEGVMPDGSITLLSSGTLLSRLRIGMAGRAGGQGVMLLSAGTADITIPGFGGRLLLDPIGLGSFPARTFDARGYAAFEVQIPGLASLRGRTLYWQMLHTDGVSLLFGNRQAVLFN